MVRLTAAENVTYCDLFRRVVGWTRIDFFCDKYIDRSKIEIICVKILLSR